MPWNESTAVNERCRFVMSYLEKQLPMSELCADYGITRPTSYKWVNRFEQWGLAGLRRSVACPASLPASHERGGGAVDAAGAMHASELGCAQDRGALQAAFCPCHRALQKRGIAALQARWAEPSGQPAQKTRARRRCSRTGQRAQRAVDEGVSDFLCVEPYTARKGERQVWQRTTRSFLRSFWISYWPDVTRRRCWIHRD